MMLTIIKILAVFIIMALMVLILMGIGYLSGVRKAEDPAAIDEFKEEVKKSESIITDTNSFSEIVKVRGSKRQIS